MEAAADLSEPQSELVTLETEKHRKAAVNQWDKIGIMLDESRQFDFDIRVLDEEITGERSTKIVVYL